MAEYNEADANVLTNGTIPAFILSFIALFLLSLIISILVSIFSGMTFGTIFDVSIFLNFSISLLIALRYHSNRSAEAATAKAEMLEEARRRDEETEKIKRQNILSNALSAQRNERLIKQQDEIDRSRKEELDNLERTLAQLKSITPLSDDSDFEEPEE